MDDRITLRQGLDKFHREYAEHLSHNQEGISNESKQFFLSHDIAHVLFNCDISLYGEGAVKIWTIFGTTLGFWKHIKAYQTVNAYALAKNFKLVDVTNNIFKFLIRIPTLIFRSRRMHRRWPWQEFEQFLDVPLLEIRKEFNIQVVK